MGQPAAKKGDRVFAIHTHVVLVPPIPMPTPTPFSFNGPIDDSLSADVNIEGQAAATQGSTASNSPQHIPVPPSGSFATPPSNMARITGGSASVNINGKPAARMGDAASACDLPGAQVIATGGAVFIG
jgi:uncharacterized Zn-binding protein involved in type VI secretion